MFVSLSYRERASDRYTITDCGFLDNFRPGDEIMADSGFTIQEKLFTRKVKPNIPVFIKGKKQLSADDFTGTRCIVSILIHIKRTIKRVTVFQDFSWNCLCGLS